MTDFARARRISGEKAMPPRIRKLFGGAGMILFLCVYALIAMALADSRPVQQTNEIVRALIYAALGLAWVPPMMPLIVWMESGRWRREKLSRR
jgi:hypothetical protein